MNRIRLLPEQVANQIAAGEVVERPASVVKELIENALDAQATRITLEIQAGGRSLIRVTDDGIGMSRDDALLCLERHATSKIQSAADLSSVRTMGFRGEAMPSIASVSRMTLTTREREGQVEAGTQVVINGGRIIEVKEAGSAAGTSVEVRNLFYNLPARRKFLRSEETERAHVQHYLSLAALAFPEVAFTFLEDKRVIWELPGVKKDPAKVIDLAALKERLRGLYGAELDLLPVDFTASLPPSFAEDDEPGSALCVWGFIGAPGLSRATRDEQHLFVNHRPVENRGLNYALLEGYHTALMKGRYPVCCLFLEIDPAAVDVNIHPAKREVKFHQEQLVKRAVTQAIRNTLVNYHNHQAGEHASASTAPVPNVSRPAEDFRPPPTHPSRADAPQVAPRDPSGVHPLSRAPSPAPAEGQENELAATTPDHVAQELPALAVTPKPEPWSAEVSSLGAHPIEGLRPGVGAPPAQKAQVAGGPPLPSPSESVPLLKVPLRLVGVIGQLYVLLESDRGLVLMDQHAAHERILFEQMLRRLEQGNAPSQRLLLPETIEVSARDAQFLREQLAALTRLGVGLSEFGERTFLLDALPPFVKVANARSFVVELIDELKATGETVNSLRLAEQMVAKTVCRHAVKANDPLADAELENLVTELRQCVMPYTCPHGRPTLIEVSFKELEKKFGRVQ